ncbi:MAG: cupin domain-containing protein [Anaerolineae bacterium]|nr:cupin domain-containing protein [Anaerolineae bacterium]
MNPMHIFHLAQLAQFKDQSPGVQVIARSGHARYVLFSFRAGQSLQEHTTSSQIAIQMVVGQVTFTARGETHPLVPGQLVLLEANVPHTLQAETDAVMLLALTPDPQRHSLAEELFDTIEPLV